MTKRSRVRTSVRLLAALLFAGAPAYAQDPDLIVDRPAMANSWVVQKRYFAPGSCTIVEGCIAAPGYRKIIRFDTKTANIAQTDLHLGDPVGNPLFEFSSCHGHYHFEDYAEYKLLDGAGNLVAPGHKQAFCLLDSQRYLNQAWVPVTPRYHCGDQGIQRGWADVYDRQLDCQWIDVTGIPNGNYVLSATVNPERVLTESNYDNNTSTTPVILTDPAGIPHRPDGFRTPGSPLRAERAGADVRVLYDVAFCPEVNYNLYYGLDHTPGEYLYDGAFCDIGTSGSATLPLPQPPPGRFVWFLVVGRDVGGQGALLEGGHGYDSAGAERPLSAETRFCSILRSQPAFVCGP